MNTFTRKEMKTIKAMILTAALATLAWGCSTSNEAEDNQAPAPASVFASAPKPEWGVDLSGSDARPEWKAVEIGRFENSMFLAVRLQDELAAHSNADDRMVVFINGECRTLLAEPNTDKEGNIYFVMRIWGNSAERGVKFALNYYSGGLHRLFTLEGEETFVSESTYGFEEDFVPPLLTAFSKYPVQHSLTVSLGMFPSRQLPTTAWLSSPVTSAGELASREGPSPCSRMWRASPFSCATTAHSGAASTR